MNVVSKATNEVFIDKDANGEYIGCINNAYRPRKALYIKIITPDGW